MTEHFRGTCKWPTPALLKRRQLRARCALEDIRRFQEFMVRGSPRDFHKRRLGTCRFGACAALLGVLSLVAGPEVLGQTPPFQLSFANAPTVALPGQAVWLDSNAIVTASGPVNWSNGIVQVEFTTNFNVR